MTESGKIEFYEVKFGNIVETISADDFVATEAHMHEHTARKLKTKKLKEQ